MENQRSNGLAVAGFVISLLTIFLGWIPIIGWIMWLLGLIFSAIGLANAKKLKGRGKGLAIGGLVISLIGIVIILFLAATFAALVGASAMTEPTSSLLLQIV